MNEHDNKKLVEPQDRPRLSQNGQPKDISRGAMTAWIVGAVVVVGLAILYAVTRLPANDPNKQCENIFGVDKECVLWGDPDGMDGYMRKRHPGYHGGY